MIPNYCNSCSEYDEMQSEIKALKERIKELEDPWIKCTDELPKKGEDIIIIGQAGFEVYENYEKEHFKAWYPDVLSWMPLIKPKEE